MSILTIFKSPEPFTIWHSHPDKKSQILITAGVDGDEYAGIEAARKLIEKYSLQPPKVPVTIIPIVNIPGNKSHVSHNPLDGRLPKNIFPGSPIGTSSSRLMHKLSQYTKGISLWIDLHGGATDEHLPSPFAWADQTGNQQVNSLTQNILSNLDSTTLYSHYTLSPSPHLAKNKTGYIVLESGELGKLSVTTINWHIQTVTRIINCFQQISSAKQKIPFSPTYQKIIYQKRTTSKTVPSNVLWYSQTFQVLGS